ncbi:VWD domain-containing protein [Spirosoma pulveris]
MKPLITRSLLVILLFCVVGIGCKKNEPDQVAPDSRNSTTTFVLTATNQINERYVILIDLSTNFIGSTKRSTIVGLSIKFNTISNIEIDNIITKTVDLINIQDPKIYNKKLSTFIEEQLKIVSSYSKTSSLSSDKVLELITVGKAEIAFSNIKTKKDWLSSLLQSLTLSNSAYAQQSQPMNVVVDETVRAITNAREDCALNIGVGLQCEEQAIDLGKAGAKLLPLVGQAVNDALNPQNPTSAGDVYNGYKNLPKSNPAHGTGDPHFLTFDGVSYDFQGHGEFVSTKSTIDNFEIQVRQEDAYKTGYVTMNTGIAIQTGTDVVCVTVKPYKLFINKQAQDLTALTTLSLKDGASITKTKLNNVDALNIINKNGDVVQVVFQNVDYLDYFIYLADNRKSKVIGLLGNYDGDKTNDILTRSGENILVNRSLSFDKLYPVYTDSWRITQANSLFYYDAGKSTDTYTQKDFPRSLQTLTTAQKANAESVCRAAGVSSEPFLSNCIFDVAITNNNALVNSALLAQQNDSRTSLPVPIIQEAVNVKRIVVTGQTSAYILKTDGTLWASGWNDFGRFGIGEAAFDNKNIFKKIMDGVQDIAGGGANHMLFLKNDNTVWAAGYNSIGQVGNGSTNGGNVLTAVKIMDGGKALYVVGFSSYVIKTDNTLWAFGEGVKRIDGSQNNTYVPTKVWDGVKDISVGDGGHVLILKTDNTLWGSGDNLYGQLNPATNFQYYPPIKLLDNVRSISTGRESSLAVKMDNTLWGAGNNRFGELGNGNNSQQRGFVKIMDGVQNVSTGLFHTLILKTDNTLWATGSNNGGQFGNGTNTDRNSAVQVMTNVKYMATGGGAPNGGISFIVKNDNTVWATGYNIAGTLGDGTTISRSLFVPINVK